MSYFCGIFKYVMNWTNKCFFALMIFINYRSAIGNKIMYLDNKRKEKENEMKLKTIVKFFKDNTNF